MRRSSQITVSRDAAESIEVPGGRLLWGLWLQREAARLSASRFWARVWVENGRSGRQFLMGTPTDDAPWSDLEDAAKEPAHA